MRVQLGSTAASDARTRFNFKTQIDAYLSWYEEILAKRKTHIAWNTDVITLFATPKPFEGHINIIQRNAIQSWSLLDPRPEILLFGNDYGTADIAREFALHHIPEVAVNEYGTPLMSDMFAQSAAIAKNQLLCYINADIILMENFAKAVQELQKRETFLVVGKRWDMDVVEPIRFEPGWEEQLLRDVRGRGELASHFHMDYFLFPKNTPFQMPPFAVGRPCWDNWTVYRMRSLGIPVIDATEKITIVHQNHSHTKVSFKLGEGWKGPEVDLNRKLAGGEDFIFSLNDATHRWDQSGIHRAMKYPDIRRHLDTIPILHPSLKPVFKVVHGAMRLIAPAWHAIRRSTTAF